MHDTRITARAADRSSGTHNTKGVLMRNKQRTAGRLMMGALVLAAQMGAHTPAHAVMGLTTRFADVVLENVQVGRLYNLRQEYKVPYTLKNLSESPAKVVIEVLVPEKKELMPDYEAVPDPSWVKLVPSELQMDGKGASFSEILLQVPDDPKYANRNYQAIIWAHSSGAGLIGVGVKSRLRFSTGQGPESLKAEKLRKAMMTLDFDMGPQALYVNDVDKGAAFDVKEKTGKSIKLTNRAESDIKLVASSVKWDGRYSIPEGYVAAPDPSWMSVSPDSLTLEGLQIKPLKVVLNIPNDPQHAGKMYAFLVKAQLQLGVEVEMFTRVFVTVK